MVLGDELMFPSEFLTHVDLKGRAVPVTIASLNIDDLRTRQGKTRKVVAKLAGKEKKFVMNKTNCKRIAEVYGNQAKAWVGKVIVIKPDKDRFGNDVVDCIRVDVAATRKHAGGGMVDASGPGHNADTGEVGGYDFGPAAMTDDEVAGADDALGSEKLKTKRAPAPPAYRRRAAR